MIASTASKNSWTARLHRRFAGVGTQSGRYAEKPEVSKRSAMVSLACPMAVCFVSDVHVEQRLGQDVEREPLQPVVDADRLAGWKPVGEPAGVLAHHRRVGLDTLPVERGLDEVPVALPLLAAGRDEPRRGDRADGLLDDGPLDELAVAPRRGRSGCRRGG